MQYITAAERIERKTLDDFEMLVIPDVRLRKRDNFIMSLFIKLYRQTGKIYPYHPRNRKKYRWTCKDTSQLKPKRHRRHWLI
ncbi:MAG: hypothetical protein JO154_09940 [Chitinophaga sp.]|uniref:hypothetical protein n=1 Tax=Chitinophaga sp. TaxID=1869181 RepID=UPI0025BF9D5E|nr:hypothetical protein [Chitinophaga sp.]MBV8252913.1 hypothetical protein [Chitinophaga sp.]